MNDTFTTVTNKVTGAGGGATVGVFINPVARIFNVPLSGFISKKYKCKF
jgi:uncharacterized spore protein YtfJ